MAFERNRWLVRAWGLTLLASLLVGCGGGTDDGSAAPALSSNSTAIEAAKAESVETIGVPGDRDSRKSRVGTPVFARSVTLQHLPRDKLASFSATVPAIGGAYAIGFAREVPVFASPGELTQLDWQPLGAGRRATAISITSPSATGVRLGLLVRKLPPDAIVRVYAQAASVAHEISGGEILLALQRNQDADGKDDTSRTYWMPLVTGQEATLEIELPNGADEKSVEIAVPRLSHLFASPTSDDWPVSNREQAKIGESGSCQVDVSCKPEYLEAGKSVARMTIVSSGNTYLCTGTLLSETSQGLTPYFLTANHCVGSQTEASTLETYWFYRNTGCNTTDELRPDAIVRRGGAALLYTSAANDTTLLRLNLPAPAGAVFSGWSAETPAIGDAVASLSNPKGDLQKISVGRIIENGLSCVLNFFTQHVSCNVRSVSLGNSVAVKFDSGIVEPGSSGAGLFKTQASKQYLVGLLTASDLSCQNPNTYALYQRFDVSYKAGIKNWLGSGTAAAATARNAVYRFYNASTGAHFYTIDADERDSVIANLKQFRYEGPAFYAYTTGGPNLSPVYRFYNTQSQAHFYTVDAVERDYVIANYPQFRYEGPKWYARTSEGDGSTALYRFFRTTNNAHFYTPDPSERDYVRNFLGDFKYEGPVYYVWVGS